MYCNIANILKDIDSNTLIQLCNDDNSRTIDEIDLTKPDDPVVIIVNDQIKEAENEINPFLISLKVLPFTIVPERISSITKIIAIKNLYKRCPTYRSNMPEEIKNDYDKVLKELDSYRKKERIIPGLENTESAKPASEIRVNKTERDRVFSKDLLRKF
jgi:hypothetical protein